MTRDPRPESGPEPGPDARSATPPDAHPPEPGAYVGRRPERQADTIPGGIDERDERIAAGSTRTGDDRGPDRPSGHREGPPADDDAVREAGQNR